MSIKEQVEQKIKERAAEKEALIQEIVKRVLDIVYSGKKSVKEK